MPLTGGNRPRQGEATTGGLLKLGLALDQTWLSGKYLINVVVLPVCKLLSKHILISKHG